MERTSIELEYIFRASPTILYQFFTSPSCLVRWFCDEVDINNDIYTFDWQGSEEEAELVDDIEEERLRFRWLESDEEEEYFEYRFVVSPVTNETILYVTDFCDEDEVEEQTEYYNNLMDKLKRATGG